MRPGKHSMASRLKEQQSPGKRKLTSSLGNQKYVTKGICPRLKVNLRDVRSVGIGKQAKQKGDQGSGQARPWRKPQEKNRPKIVRFHCGGNSADPLNLNSLINRDPSITTPQASPLSEHSESPVQVLEPRDKTDPLNLKGAVLEPEIKESAVTPKKRKKRKRHNVNHDAENEAKPKDQLNDSDGSISEGRRKRKRNAVRTDDEKKAEVNAKTTDCFAMLAGSNDHTSVMKKDNETTSKKKACFNSSSSEEAKALSYDVKMENSVSEGKPKDDCEIADQQNVPGFNKGKNPKRDKHHPAKRPEKKEKLFIYGNYNRYYGYRNPHCTEDLRLKCFKKEWIEGKDVLDLGCNVGHVTLALARDLHPRIIMGIDIDTGLVKAAKNNLRYYMNCPTSVPGKSERGVDFPVSFSITSGPLAAPIVFDLDEKTSFPHNVVFKQVS